MAGSTLLMQFSRFSPTPTDLMADLGLEIKNTNLFIVKIDSNEFCFLPCIQGYQIGDDDDDLWYFTVFTCGNRYAPRQPIFVCLVGVVKPEIIVRPRKTIGELNWIADFAWWYRGIRWRISIGRIVHQPIKSILLFIHIGNFYHEVSTEATLQK